MYILRNFSLQPNEIVIKESLFCNKSVWYSWVVELVTPSEITRTDIFLLDSFRRHRDIPKFLQSRVNFAVLRESELGLESARHILDYNWREWLILSHNISTSVKNKAILQIVSSIFHSTGLYDFFKKLKWNLWGTWLAQSPKSHLI